MWLVTVVILMNNSQINMIVFIFMISELCTASCLHYRVNSIVFTSIILLYGYSFRSFGNFAFHIQIQRKIKVEIQNNSLVMEGHNR